MKAKVKKGDKNKDTEKIEVKLVDISSIKLRPTYRQINIYLQTKGLFTSVIITQYNMFKFKKLQGTPKGKKKIHTLK